MMNSSIESPANPRIKELVKLRDSPRHRKRRNRFFVEGFSDLNVLVEAGKKVKEVYHTPSTPKHTEVMELLNKLSKIGVQVIETSSQAQKKASYRSVDNDLLAVMECWENNLFPEALDKPGPVIVLDELEKPGNLGAILRSVEAFGGAGVILSDPVLDFFNPNVVRSSRGLMGSLPVYSGSKPEVYDWLKNSHRKIVATSSRATELLGMEKLPNSLALVFGSEKVGLGEFWKNSVENWIKIPMQGTASSFNLNVSVSCFLYEYNRIRVP